MKELLNTIDKRFTKELLKQKTWSAGDVAVLYSKIKEEVLLDYLNGIIGK